MNANDQGRFVTILTGVADYYERTLPASVISLYWAGLRAYDLAAVEKAMWEHTQSPDESGRWMPKIADIKQKLEGRTQDQASIAWAKVDSGVRKVGTYRDVVFDDGMIHRVLADMGGWIALGRKTEVEWPFIAKEFENRYRGYRLRSEAPDFPPVLIGISNAQNEHQGFQKQEPVLIGDAEKAKQVMLLGTTKPLIAMQLLSAAANSQEQMRRIA
ncbi:DUF6475 domain-containing protein [Undibacterium sp. SXout7W]|uniref:DUF6475 domain-containing protein n=1 Tax=Undibacterium sp. SXout7W TaxID=3413049 RepID=UPI003BEF9079